MKRYRSFFLVSFALLLFAQCKKAEADLPAPDAVMVKFVNKTGADLEGLVVSRASIGTLGKGSTTAEHFRFETLGQQFGFALVEAVATLDGETYYTSSACQGVCGTASAPSGTWLDPGYYKVSIRIDPDEPNALEFRLLQ